MRKAIGWLVKIVGRSSKRGNMTREELLQMAIDASANTKSIRNIECPQGVLNPGIYYGFMIAVEVLWPEIEKLKGELCNLRLSTTTDTSFDATAAFKQKSEF